VLLTRSPLSPDPKAWFSLDLHVLSAPPAFVLSQDQTLREEWLPARGRRSSAMSLCSTVYPEGQTGFRSSRRGLTPEARGLDVRTLLSFQRPRCWPAKKSPRLAPEASKHKELRGRIRCSLEALQLSSGQGPCIATRSGSRGIVATPLRVSSGRNGAFRPGGAAPRGIRGARPARSPARRPSVPPPGR
jgi:hypothetical protein